MSDLAYLDRELASRGHNADDVYWMAIRHFKDLEDTYKYVAKQIDMFWGDKDIDSDDMDEAYQLLEDLAYRVFALRDKFVECIERELQYAESN